LEGLANEIETVFACQQIHRGVLKEPWRWATFFGAYVAQI
jgi:hypothetical protein